MLFQYETARLILKIHDETHARQVLDFYVRNRNYFSPFEPQVSEAFYTETYQQKHLAYEMQEMLNGSALRYFIYLKSDPDHLIGAVNLSHIVHGSFSRASLGYKIDQQYTNQGYATEAVLKMLQIAATDLKLHRIEARVMPDNVPSIHLLQNLNFQYEGMEYQSIRIRNDWQDLHRYSLLLY